MGRPRRARVSSRKRSAPSSAAGRADAVPLPVSASDSDSTSVPKVTPVVSALAPEPAPVPAAAASEAAAAVAPAAPSPPSSSSSLADELKSLVEGLLFLSESEAPFTIVQLPKDAILPDALRELTKLPADAPAEEWAVADLLTPFTTPDQPDAASYQALLIFLETKLARTTAYKLGEVKKPVFFLGRQPDKSWLGVQTEAVET